MFAWWWLIIALIVGACLGAVLMGICAYNRSDLENARGWDDE